MTIELSQRTIGGDAPTFIIAEMSANHLGEYDKALAIIDAAAEAGADAIKLQTYKPETMTLNCDRPEFTISGGTLWDGRKLYDLYADAMTPWEWHEPLKLHAEKRGLLFLSTPFDPTAVALLESLEVEIYKLASFEITDIELMQAIAATGKPVIFSSGIAERADIELAIKTMREAGAGALSLLKCISSYPAPVEEYNLKTLELFESDLGVIPGISDHSPGYITPVVAVSLGAKIVEKHLCLDRSLGGPDADFSLEPAEFASMVEAIRTAEKALGRKQFTLSKKQKSGKQFARSLFFCRDLQKGAVISEDDLTVVRPGYGLHPRYKAELLGRRLVRDVSMGEPLSWDLLD